VLCDVEKLPLANNAASSAVDAGTFWRRGGTT